MICNETCQGNSQIVILLKLKLFKLKMKQSKVSQGFFPDFVSMAKHMIVSYLDSSKSERCAVKFSEMFLARYKGKILILKIKLL